MPQMLEEQVNKIKITLEINFRIMAQASTMIFTGKLEITEVNTMYTCEVSSTTPMTRRFNDRGQYNHTNTQNVRPYFCSISNVPGHYGQHFLAAKYQFQDLVMFFGINILQQINTITHTMQEQQLAIGENNGDKWGSQHF